MILLVGCALLEMGSPGMFFFLSFSLGAGIAALFSLYANNPTAEFIMFLCASVVSFLLLKRYVKSISKDTFYTTNVYALRGKKAIVTETISSVKRGWVTIDGQIWAASADDESTIEKGSLVLVVNSAGSHLIVKKLDIPS